MKASGRVEKPVTRRYAACGILAAGGFFFALAGDLTLWNQPARDERRSATKAARRTSENSSSHATLERIRWDPDTARRDERIAALLEKLDAPGIVSFFGQLQSTSSGSSADETSIRLLRAWAEIDPAAAAAWVAGLSLGEMRSAALGQVASVWAVSNLPDAAKWARSLSDDAERASAIIAVGTEAVRTEPFTALALAADLPGGVACDELLRRATMEWASTDAAAAAEWAKTVEDETLRAHLVTGIAIAGSESDPVAAATLAANELPPGRPQADAVVAVVQRWSARDPAAAAVWVASLPNGTVRRDAIESLMAQWSKKAPEEAASWHAKATEPVSR